jgi:hypothetical protein
MNHLRIAAWVILTMLLAALHPVIVVAGVLYETLQPSHPFALAMNPQQYPTLEQFAANVAAVIGKIEIVEQELYDRILYPTAGQNQFTFFAVPKGAGITTETSLTSAKTDADTNMTQNGQLPAPQAFWIDNLQLDFDPGSVSTANTFTTQSPTTALAAAAATQPATVADKNAVLNAGWLQLNIGQKPYYTNGPLAYFPPRAQKRVDVAIGNSDTTTHNEVVTALMWIYGDLRTLDPGLGLATGFNFNVFINFPVLVATPSGFNGRLKCLLGGWLFRAAQ